MIPVEVTQTPWHYTTWLDLFDHWQTVIAGVFALLAAFGTVVATMIIARRQIAASRAEADRVIAATREQTRATFRQTETTVDLRRMRDASEALAFHTMLEAAMARVLAEGAWARKTYPRIIAQNAGYSNEAGYIRQCITKGGFAELRATCVQRGSPLTGEFLDLEREIDSFARQMNLQAGLDEQLGLIETSAVALRQKAVEQL